MLILSDKSVSDIINRDMSCINYVATFGDKLYYTDYDTHTVTCCDLHGTTLWEFKDELLLFCLANVLSVLRLTAFYYHFVSLI
jgi:hypothetical protein